MYETPRIRRLRNDLAAMERLQAESSVLRFRAEGKPATDYTIEFRGNSLVRERSKVTIQERHQVSIRLGASYPRTMPELRWMTPIYHPNISEIGMVCLGGYGTHWVPSLTLEELCGMLWDMARFHNYDIRSPYNREAALWVANQTTFRFPLDARPLRDVRVALGRIASDPAGTHPPEAAKPGPAPIPEPERPRPGAKARDFARWYAEQHNGALAASGPPPDDLDPDEGVVILDLELDIPPRPPRPPQGEEIVFLD